VDALAARSMQKHLRLPQSLWDSTDGDAPPAAAAGGRCDIAVRDETLSSDDFYDNFVSLNRPVLVRRATARDSGGTSSSEGGSSWDVEMLQRLFGSQPLQSVNIPYAAMFVGGKHSETTLPQFLAEMESADLDVEQKKQQHYRYIFQTVSPAQEEVLRSTAAPRRPAVLEGPRLQAATRPGKPIPLDPFVHMQSLVDSCLNRKQPLTWQQTPGCMLIGLLACNCCRCVAARHGTARHGTARHGGTVRRQVPAVRGASGQWFALTLAQRCSELCSARGEALDPAASATCSVQPTACHSRHGGVLPQQHGTPLRATGWRLDVRAGRLGARRAESRVERWLRTVVEWRTQAFCS